MQTDGFSGRTNKPADVCYTFWVGASIHILDPCAIDLVDTELLFRFLERAKFKGGGFGKFENSLPDLLHSYMGLAGFGIFHGNVKKVEVLLNIREDIMKDLTF